MAELVKVSIFSYSQHKAHVLEPSYSNVQVNTKRRKRTLASKIMLNLKISAS